MEKLLSVAIPTFNRSQYAVSCIQSLLQIEGNLEVVVSDSSDDFKLKQLLEDDYSVLLQDKRLKYSFTSERLDMTANLNRALDLCEGHYVTCIGDDDTIVPEILHYLHEFKVAGVSLISPDVVVNYAWPDFSTRFFKNGHKANVYFNFQKPYLQNIQSTDALNAALNNCFQGTDGLPKLYHGFVARSLLLDLKKRTGNYLHGSTPDMSAAIGLCFVAKHFMRCNFPLTIPGASGMSNTGRAANNKHVGKLEDESQTAAISRNSWIAGIPRFFSVEIVWAQAGLDTAAKFDKQIAKKFPFIKFLGLCLVNHPSYYRVINRAFDAVRKNGFSERIFLFWHSAVFASKRGGRLLLRASKPNAANGRFVMRNVPNIFAAQQQYLTKRPQVQNFIVQHNIEMIKQTQVH